MCQVLLVWNGYGTGMEWVWNGHPAQHHFSGIEVLHSMVRNGGVWNGIRGLDPELWIGMCARPCSGPFILSGSHMLQHPAPLMIQYGLKYVHKCCRSGTASTFEGSSLQTMKRPYALGRQLWCAGWAGVVTIRV